MSSSNQSVRFAFCVAGFSALVVSMAGCASDDDAVKESTPKFVRADTEDLAGVYEADESVSIHASDTLWRMGEGAYTVESIDSEGDFAILKNDAENADFPEKFTRVDWTVDDERMIRLCVSVADAASAKEAAAAEPDASDFEGGCAGEEWSTLALPVLGGTFMDEFDTTYRIDNENLTMEYTGSDPMKFALLEVSSKDGYFLAQNDAKAAYSPSLFSRFDYFSTDDKSTYYCQTVFDAPTLKAAREAQPADRTSLDKGCGQGFAWSQLTRQ